MKKTSVLITGGAGYIGSHCTLELLKDYDVVVFDSGSNVYKDKKSEKPESLLRVEKLAGKTISYIEGDIQNCNDLQKVFTAHRISCVIHCAALKSVKESVDQPLDYYSTNVAGSVNLLKVMTHHAVNKIIFSSSATVYGDPEYVPIDENHPTGANLANPYGRTKYVVEELLKDVLTSDNKWMIYSLRYFNPVGAHPSGQIGENPLGIPNNLMPIVTRVALGQIKTLQVYGNDYGTVDGTGVRDYIHIMDLAEGHVAAVNQLVMPSTDHGFFKAINLGTGHGTSVLQMVKTFEEVNGVKIPYTIVGRRAGDVDESFCGISLAEKHLGWKAKRSLEEMCKDSWNWQIKNPNGYSS